jgi:hypothetical protein
VEIFWNDLHEKILEEFSENDLGIAPPAVTLPLQNRIGKSKLIRSSRSRALEQSARSIGSCDAETRQTDIADLKMRLMRAEKFARKSGDRSEVDDLRRQYVEAKIEAYVQRVVAEAPPLTEDQKNRLRSLFSTAGDRDVA